MHSTVAKILSQLPRGAVSALLVIAAVLKVEYILRLERFSGPLLRNCFLLIIEFAFAVWIAKPAFSLLAWVSSTALFLVFFIASVQSQLSHEPACGCFGRIGVPPRVSALIDLSALGALAVAAGSIVGPTKPRALIRASPLLIAVLAGAGMLGMSRLRAEHPPVKVVVPEQLVGTIFPLISDIDSQADAGILLKGRWTVLMYHPDCDECAQAMRELTSTVPLRPLNRRYAAIEVPSLGATPLVEVPLTVSSFRLSRQQAWYVPTPLFVALDDGRVMSTSTHLPRYAGAQ